MSTFSSTFWVILILTMFLSFQGCKTSKQIPEASADSVKINCTPRVTIYQWPENDIFVRMKTDSSSQVYPFVDEFHMTSLSNLKFTISCPTDLIKIEKEDKGGYYLFELTPEKEIPDSIRYIDIQIWYSLPVDTLVVFQECSEKEKNRKWLPITEEFPSEKEQVLLYTYTFVNEQDGYLYNIGGYRGTNKKR